MVLATVQGQGPRMRQRQGRPGRRKQGASSRQEEAPVSIPLSRTPVTEDFVASPLTCQGAVSFELITGFVFSSSKEIIDSRVGTLLLSDCIELCRGNNGCRALNFETGLCVLFRSAAGEDSGKGNGEEL